MCPKWHTDRKGQTMFNKYMAEKELNVKVGDRVCVQGYKGTVIDIDHSIRQEWNGEAYVDVAGTESTTVQVHFDEEESIAEYGQYQDGWYGGYTVIDKEAHITLTGHNFVY